MTRNTSSIEVIGIAPGWPASTSGTILSLHACSVFHMVHGARQSCATFDKKRVAQTATCDPISGRYVLLRALTEVAGGPWASVAELGVLGK